MDLFEPIIFLTLFLKAVLVGSLFWELGVIFFFHFSFPFHHFALGFLKGLEDIGAVQRWCLISYYADGMMANGGIGYITTRY